MNVMPEQFSASATIVTRRGPWADVKRLPLVIQLVMLFMISIFVLDNPSFFGYNLTGLAWVVPFATALIVISSKFKQISFPYPLWLPWVMLLFAYLLFVDWAQIDPRVFPQQRTAQLLCPLAVGMAVSTWRATVDDLLAFLATCRRLACLLLLIVFLKTGVLLTGILPKIATGLAPETITVTLLCTLFVASHIILRSKKDLILWVLLACVPIMALTRTAIAVSLLTFPLTFAPLPLIRRIVVLILIAFAGVALFNTERVQKKMFYSGRGTINDIRSGNLDFATTGRRYMSEKMLKAAKSEQWTGHGSGMGETFTYLHTHTNAYPHNDWMLTLYDYGLLGVSIFFTCCLLSARHALQQLWRGPDDATRILFLTGAAAYLPFALIMFTDNIMVYAPYFGNLHFIFIGLAYGSMRAKQESALLQDQLQ